MSCVHQVGFSLHGHVDIHVQQNIENEDNEFYHEGAGCGVYGLCHVQGLSSRRTEFYPRHVRWGLVVDNEALWKVLLRKEQIFPVSNNPPALDICTHLSTKQCILNE
jgi:hypothetical protein